MRIRQEEKGKMRKNIFTKKNNLIICSIGKFLLFLQKIKYDKTLLVYVFAA
jgi:hypothetical protein